ncbi:VOC family protein [Patescibacteria group bacterium]|nr:VOC family protein [Patescibacteria group bacterium]MBU1500518.1 VOC family protein [Patescibacteria group bacterium]MBU2080683.1 VOC family protein [Patescibacteria group bacterium]MBU2123788.1 VOC family protein [Patescibacteria group bacterium]MBU2194921.1 VOC family protein [Patescibacteria group bacterium]
MIAHLTIHVNDIEASKTFYTKALAPLGYELLNEYPEWKLASFGKNGNAEIWLYGAEGAKQEGHIAFVAESKEQVEQFYSEGLTAGGTDNGAPGYRKNYAPGYYASFVYDPSKNNIEAVFMDPEPSE